MESLKIGTRGSDLALKQASLCAEKLRKYFSKVEIVKITTTGDRVSKLSAVKVCGYTGKGLFVKEIESALISKKIDIAVHSLKDVPQEIPANLKFCAYLKRGSPFDLFISKKYSSLKDLPKNATVGTSSPRRMAQVKMLRPDLNTLPLRGNVPTRLEKLARGEFDAIILAEAGLKRLGLLSSVKYVERLNDFVPAVGQGIIAIEMRRGEYELEQAVREALNDPETESCAICERAFLSTVGGDCHTPIACLAKKSGRNFSAVGFVSDIVGRKILQKKITADSSFKAGRLLGERFIKAGARNVLKIKRGGGTLLLTGLADTNRSLFWKLFSKFEKIVELPLIKILPPTDAFKGLDLAIKNLGEFDWVIFTSKNSVDSFFAGFKIPPSPPLHRVRRVVVAERGARGDLKFACVGSGTAGRLMERGFLPDLVGEQGAVELASKLLKVVTTGTKILFPKSEHAKDLVSEKLAKGGCCVLSVPAYRTVPVKISGERLEKFIKENSVSSVFFASQSAEDVFKRSVSRSLSSRLAYLPRRGVS